MKKSNKFLAIFLILAILIISFFAFRVFVLRIGRGDVEKVGYGELTDSFLENGEDDSKKESEVLKDEIVENGTPLIKEEIELPEKVLLDVTFLSQAPFGVWDEYHEEACEEASLIMVEYYLSGKKLNNEIGESEIQGMIRFQMRKFGDFKDTSVSETVEIAKEFYGRKNLRVVYDFEKEDIKKELVKGNPVILAAAGRLLGNPNFTPPGPLYHNLVAIGYDGDTIITNDPGTRKGAGYEYNIDVLYNAIHDFTGNKDDIMSGRKAMIVVESVE